MHQNGYNGISEETVEIDICGLLCGGWTLEDTTLKSCKVQTFKDAGVLSNDNGIVIVYPDGSEFQITIRQSG